MKAEKLNRRTFLKMSAIAAAGTALTACATATAQPTTAPAAGEPSTESAAEPTTAAAPSTEEVTITFMGWGGVEEDEGVQAAVKVFQDEQPNIKVTWMYTPDLYDEKMNTYIAAGTAPDTAFISEGAYPTYANDNLLMDITDNIASDELIGQPDYFIEPLEQNRSVIHGKWYGIGSCWTNFHIFYNADIFTDAGIEPPSNDPAQAWTWDHFREVAQQLTVDKNGKHPNDSGFDLDNVDQWGAWWANDWAGPFINIPMVNGGYFYNPEEGEFALDQEADYVALQNVADLMLVDHVMPQVAAFSGLGMSASQMLENRKLAMAIDGSWALSWMYKIKATLGTAVLPKMASPGTFARAHSHSVFQSSKRPEAGWQWVRFLATPFYESQFCKIGLWLPNQTALMTEEGLKTWMDPEVHPAGYEMIVKDYMEQDGKTFLYPLHWNEAYNDLIKPGLDAVWNGDQKAQGAFATITPQANAVIEKV